MGVTADRATARQGTTVTTFEPDAIGTRAQAVIFLYRAEDRAKTRP